MARKKSKAEQEYNRLRRNYNRRVKSWLSKGYAIKETMPEILPTYQQAKKSGALRQARRVLKRAGKLPGYEPFKPSKAEAKRRALTYDAGRMRYIDTPVKALQEELDTYKGMVKNFRDWLTREIDDARTTKRYNISDNVMLKMETKGNVGQYLINLMQDVNTGIEQAGEQGREEAKKNLNVTGYRATLILQIGKYRAILKLLEQAQGTLGGLTLVDWIYGSAIKGQTSAWNVLEEFRRVFRRESKMFINL